ncbi:hypothetical protein QJS66_04140 [Kocuria rhizophila]|nr:hypothetical protein QJS66_04140 [Kocuria rhizophila]
MRRVGLEALLTVVRSPPSAPSRAPRPRDVGFVADLRDPRVVWHWATWRRPVIRDSRTASLPRSTHAAGRPRPPHPSSRSRSTPPGGGCPWVRGPCLPRRPRRGSRRGGWEPDAGAHRPPSRPPT